MNIQMPFQDHKLYILRKLAFNKKNGLEINLQAFYPDILM